MSNLIISPTTNHGLILLVSCITIFTITYAQECNPSRALTGTQAPAGQCDPTGSECCKPGSVYQTYECSPPVTSQTAAVLTLNSFAEGGDGGGPSECDEQYHSDDTLVVALSTGWFAEKAQCGKEIAINGNGRTTRALVVDQCDSTMGCDQEHGFQPPCGNNVVDASKAVWEALGVDPNSSQYGEMDITWSDA